VIGDVNGGVLAPEEAKSLWKLSTFKRSKKMFHTDNKTKMQTEKLS